MDSLKYPFSQTSEPANATQVEVQPGVMWLRMPLPWSLDHINLYLLEDRDGWLLLDTGLDSPLGRELWQQHLQWLGEKPIRQILVSHHHPDHIGMAGWLAEQTGAELLMTPGEYRHARWLLERDGEISEDEYAHYFARAGIEYTEASRLFGLLGSYGQMVSSLPDGYVSLESGTMLTIGGCDWQVITTSGHSIEQAVLYCAERELLLAADQVLPTITPNVSVNPWHVDAQPLRAWFEALARLESLPESTLVLPAHGKPFYGLHERLAAIRASHRERLARLEDLCREPRTCSSLVELLFRPDLDTGSRFFALGETLAHLNHLHEVGRINRFETASRALLYQS